MNKEAQERNIRATKRKTELQQFIKKVFTEYGIPVDKWGHLYIRGNQVVDDLVNPDFDGDDLTLALLLRACGGELKSQKPSASDAEPAAAT